MADHEVTYLIGSSGHIAERESLSNYLLVFDNRAKARHERYKGIFDVIVAEGAGLVQNGYTTADVIAARITDRARAPNLQSFRAEETGSQQAMPVAGNNCIGELRKSGDSILRNFPKLESLKTALASAGDLKGIVAQDQGRAVRLVVFVDPGNRGAASSAIGAWVAFIQANSELTTLLDTEDFTEGIIEAYQNAGYELLS